MVESRRRNRTCNWVRHKIRQNFFELILKTEAGASARAQRLAVANDFEPLSKLRSLAVQFSENAERSHAGERIDERSNLIRPPSCKLYAFHRILCDFGQVVDLPR